MIAEWFLYIGGQEEGPFTFEDLEKDSRLSFKTFVWKDGLEDWTPIEKVPELKAMIEKRKSRPPSHDEEMNRIRQELSQEDEVITLQSEPPYWIIWVLVVLLALLFAWFIT